MVNQALLTEAKRLTPADRLELISELWQSLDVEALSVSDADRQLSNERVQNLSDHPDIGRSWDSIEADLLHRLP